MKFSLVRNKQIKFEHNYSLLGEDAQIGEKLKLYKPT
jgi:hypothetical protein